MALLIKVLEGWDKITDNTQDDQMSESLFHMLSRSRYHFVALKKKEWRGSNSKKISQFKYPRMMKCLGEDWW